MSRKSARIAAKPPKPFSEDGDESGEEVEQEVEVKSKGKRATPAKGSFDISSTPIPSSFSRFSFSCPEKSQGRRR
jgi:hypothetical protein